MPMRVGHDCLVTCVLILTWTDCDERRSRPGQIFRIHVVRESPRGGLRADSEFGGAKPKH